MIKLTVLYGHPENSEMFEKYYSETHLPIAAKMQGVLKMETTKFFPQPDGSISAYYRMAELYFQDAEALQKTIASAEGQATAADLANFATGGATLLVGQVEN